MLPSNDKTDRKKIGIHQTTYDQLKDFSRFNGIKLRWLIDAMATEMLQDDAIRQRIIDNALSKQQDDD